MLLGVKFLILAVENFSYAFDGTDPVSGEQYSGGWRATYTVLGMGEMVLTALGIKASGEAVIGALRHPVAPKPAANLAENISNVTQTTPAAQVAEAAKMAEATSQVGAQVGNSFGKLGTVVDNPGVKITSISKHALNQSITRGVNSSTMLNTVKNPTVVLQQSSGNYLFLTRDAVVVTTPAGRVVTTYPSSMFDSGIWNILK